MLSLQFLKTIDDMCRFSENNKHKLGNVILYIAKNAKYAYKTEILKLLFLMEERMVQQYHIPFLGIPFLAWRLGPVSVDVFQELSDGPVLLADHISLNNIGKNIKVLPIADFDEEEFSDAELKVMQDIINIYGDMTSEQLIEETHKEGSLWYVTAKENDLLDDFDSKRANVSTVELDMGRCLCPTDRMFYEETLAIRKTANAINK